MRSCGRILFFALLCLGCRVETERETVQLASLNLIDDAMNARDAARFAQAHGASASLDVVGFAVAPGRAAIATRVEDLFRGFPDAEFGFARIWLQDEVIIAEWVLRGAQTGAIGGIAPTGEVAGVRGASVLSFDAAGEVQRHVVYFDAVTVLSQLEVQAGPARPVPEMPETPELHFRRAQLSEQALAAWSQEFYEAFESGETTNISPLLQSDLHFENLVEPSSRVGADAFVDLFTGYTTAFPDNSIVKAGEWYFEDAAVVENVVTATHLGPLGPIPPTGLPVHLRFLDVLEIDGGGGLVAGYSYTNYLDLFQQLGVFQHGDNSNAPDAHQRTAPP